MIKFSNPSSKEAKIKIFYGCHSVLYGQGGLAGVINIIAIVVLNCHKPKGSEK
ncbi:MAG: hypothetical protein K8S13_02020 [Desulfobacula sp.]|uniref:hypothetical protein n=1 Tax=Desulfobacula sp. TaxID=2593537 RepID=UPI0025C27BE2|nr:hypothetical protein [Desulfobacula sp.]MCD4718623.1 hypothetical protein [Desulfobacula sp.]